MSCCCLASKACFLAIHWNILLLASFYHFHVAILVIIKNNPSDTLYAESFLCRVIDHRENGLVPAQVGGKLTESYLCLRVLKEFQLMSSMPHEIFNFILTIVWRSLRFLYEDLKGFSVLLLLSDLLLFPFDLDT